MKETKIDVYRPEMMRRAMEKAAKFLPEFIDRQRWVDFAITYLKQKSLHKCSPESLLSALYGAAKLGLPLDDVLGMAHIIPYKSQAVLVIGYRGELYLMWKSGKVSHVEVGVVYESELKSGRFEFFQHEEGGECKRRLYHAPDLAKSAKEKGKIVAAYAIFILTDGQRVPIIASQDDIEKAKSKSPAYRAYLEGSTDQAIWEEFEESMAIKTAIHKGPKYLPFLYDSPISTAIKIEDRQAEGSLPVDVSAVDIESPAEAVMAEELREKLEKTKKKLEKGKKPPEKEKMLKTLLETAKEAGIKEEQIKKHITEHYGVELEDAGEEILAEVYEKIIKGDLL